MRLATVFFALTLGGCALLSAPQPQTAQFDWFAYQGKDPVYDKIKAGPDDYRNPILAGFYPDPSVVRVGEDYYLVTSSFAYFPGIPVFHSRDLVDWTQIGNVIARPSQLEFKGLRISRGIFGPAIAYHDGVFYLLNTCVDCGENYLVTATNPAGPWSDPKWLGFQGIDPSLFFDDDGKAYIVNNGPPEGAPLYNGHRAIWIQQFDIAAKKLIGPRRVIVNGGSDISKKPNWIEGPHLFRRDGKYYLTCAEGGTGTRHSEVVFRADAIWGPYVPYAGNPILSQRDLDPARPDPITSTGHAQLVQTQNGDWWAVFLGTRPYADDSYNTGRETFLLPVHWTDDGWPVILDAGKPVPYVAPRPALPQEAAPASPTSGNFTLRDDFHEAALAPYWLFIRTPHEEWFDLKPGRLTIRARPDSIGGLGQPSFIGRRQQHMSASASTAMRYTPRNEGDEAGLVAFQNQDYYYFIGLALIDGKTVVCLKRRASAADDENGMMITSAPIALADGAPVYLKIEARGRLYDFAYATREGEWTLLAKDQDGTILSTHTAGGFVGTVIGMYAYTAGN
jgi:alpha-N-arabinofuranosidase